MEGLNRFHRLGYKGMGERSSPERVCGILGAYGANPDTVKTLRRGSGSRVKRSVHGISWSGDIAHEPESIEYKCKMVST